MLRLSLSLLLLACATVPLLARPGLALPMDRASAQTQTAQIPDPTIPPLAPAVPGEAVPAPTPDPLEPLPPIDPEPSAPADAPEAASPEPADASGLPPIMRDPAQLPGAVRLMRDQLMEAARSGDIERLRPLMQEQPQPPAVAYGDPGDPINYLKALASDVDGREVLAILLEVLESGFVHVGQGTAEEFYVWPYFAQYPVETLTPEQLVELFTLLTAADYEDMRSYGTYTFFRVGIAPDGRWLFFLAGD
jgi:hypothetical protein